MNSLNKLIFASIALLGTTAMTQAADLMMTSPGVVVADAPTSDWDGAYIGLHAGYATAFADHTSGPGTNDLNLAGGFIGAQIGGLFHLSDGVVGGIEADVALANITGAATFAFDTTHTIDWKGSVRGNLGFDAGNFMPYVTGGLAFAHAVRTTSAGAPNSASATHMGWTAGAGVMIQASENVIIDLKYRYSDYGSQLYVWSGPGIDPTIAMTSHEISAGINWKF